MSFEAYEVSPDDSQAVELYRFTLSETVWRYTSANHDVVTLDGFVWKSVAISNEGVKQSGEAASDVMNVMAPLTIGPVQVHLVTPPSRAIQLVILRKQEQSTELVACWAGEVTQVNVAVPGQARLTCETTAATMRREGLRLGWQRACPYALYDSLTCKVDKTSFAVTLRVLAKLGFVMIMDNSVSEPDGWFNGGFIHWVHPVRGNEYRSISNHIGNNLTIFGTVEDIYEGLVVSAYPGCARTVGTCVSKFNNLANYGGIPHMPGSSPFDGDPVFY